MRYFLSLLGLLLCSESIAEQSVSFSFSELRQDKNKTENLLRYTLSINRIDLAEKLLNIYETFGDKDSFSQAQLAQSQQHYTKAISLYQDLLAISPNLFSAKFELAKSLYANYQYQQAKSIFELLQKDASIPQKYQNASQKYLNLIREDQKWKFSFGSYYIYDKNINKTSSVRSIENTGFIKNDNMLPQTAKGFGYYASLTKHHNVIDNHYFSFDQNITGKYFFDNKKYNDLYQRTRLGYHYKTAHQQIAFKPFVDWFRSENRSHYKSAGMSIEHQFKFTPKIQLYSVIEYNKLRYFDDNDQNGNSKLFSTTIVWQPEPLMLFYLGYDFIRESTKLKRYSNDKNSIRLSWRKKWHFDIESSIYVNYAIKQRKDYANLGGILPLGKIRKDHIYSVNLILAKSDWMVFGVTPKLKFHWKKQSSNIPSLYNYSEKQVNLLFEKGW